MFVSCCLLIGVCCLCVACCFVCCLFVHSVLFIVCCWLLAVGGMVDRCSLFVVSC